jgi:DNA-directed RNA polymerase subunit RPC12/RpoP
MLSEISIGMTVKCLRCGKPIKLTDKTLGFDELLAEYIKCPNCLGKIDVIYYHFHGELVDEVRQ